MSDGLAGFIGGMLFAILALGLLVKTIGKDYPKEAIEHGFAEYVIVDQNTGRTEFQWKTQPHEQP